MQRKDAFLGNFDSVGFNILIYFRDYLIYLTDNSLNNLVIESEIVISFIDRVGLAKRETGLSNGIFSVVASGASNVSEDDLFDFLKDLTPLDLVFEYFHSILNLSVGLVD
jgi:hypothetical protein